MERVPEEHTEQPADFADELDQLAVVEAELSAAEAELVALEEPALDTDAEPAS